MGSALRFDGSVLIPLTPVDSLAKIVRLLRKYTQMTQIGAFPPV
jgi:hypothetical protein